MTEQAGPAAWDFQSAANQTPQPAKARQTARSTEIRTDTPHLARIYDYWLGGKNNYPADRVVAEMMIETVPEIRAGVRVNRAFLRNAVRFLAAECGVRQFLDIGTGLPAADNTHEVAQRVAADARIVYVDNDPLVLAHAHALLTSTPEGVTAYLDGDLRDPVPILDQAAATLDFTQPVALMLVAILHAIPDEHDPHAAVALLRDALPAGSYLVLSHLGLDVYPDLPHLAKGVDELNTAAPGTLVPRDRNTVQGFFDGWELLEPGLVPAPTWRQHSEHISSMWAGVARKPKTFAVHA